MTVAGLVLAAGAGRRFGGPKALVELDGERLVDRMVRVLRAGGCQPLVVVAGAVPLAVSDATVVDNPDWRTGMGSSLRSGLAALPDQASAAVVVLVDTPWIGPDAVDRLVQAHATGAGAPAGVLGAAAAPTGVVPRHPPSAIAAPAPTWQATQTWSRSTARVRATRATSITPPRLAGALVDLEAGAAGSTATPRIVSAVTIQRWSPR